MAKDPAVLFYTSDFLSKTEFFSFEQKGQYIHLLCVQHQNGHIPEIYMEKILGDRSNTVWDKFQKDENGLWFQDRMENETQRRKNYSKSRRDNISNRYVDTHEDTYVDDMKPHMETETVTETITKAVKDNIPESLDFVIEYGKEIEIPAEECEKFFDYFSSNGWRVGGKAPMKNWKSALRNWKRNLGKFGGTNAGNYGNNRKSDANKRAEYRVTPERLKELAIIASSTGSGNP